MSQNLETYIGLADCQGLVSFIHDPNFGKSFMKMLYKEDAEKNPRKKSND